MADRVEFKVINEREFRRAVDLAPKKVFGSIRREFNRAGKKFGTAARKQLLSGPPGIFLPAAQSKKGGRKQAKQVQKQNIRTKTGGRKNIFLVAYASKFLEFHEQKVRGPFLSLFRSAIPRITERVRKEAVRITQAVLDKELRDVRR